MSIRLGLRCALVTAAFAFALMTPVRAVIFYATADPAFNTTAPTGLLAGSGWQWTGYWGGFQGTVIGPHHFIAARHVGGTVGDVFVLNNISYTTVASFDDTVSDLRIWQVGETFPDWAPLYRNSNEVGKSLMVFGRGLTRGAEVRDVATNTLRGWQWGAGDGQLRWGQNAVKSTVEGGSYWGALLYATFDAAGGTNEAHLATGDSSGPVFINDGSGWKLAGVAAAVDGYFNTTSSGSGFNAAIFDARGLYYGNSGGWSLVSGATASPSGFYATRVSVRAAWIDSVAPTGSDTSDVPLLGPSGMVTVALALFSAGAVSIRRRISTGT